MNLDPLLLEELRNLSDSGKQELMKTLLKMDTGKESEVVEAIESADEPELLPKASSRPRTRRGRTKTVTEYKVAFRPSTETLLLLLERSDRETIRHLVGQLRAQGPWAVAAEPFNGDQYLTRVGDSLCLVFTLQGEQITIVDVCSYAKLQELYGIG